MRYNLFTLTTGLAGLFMFSSCATTPKVARKGKGFEISQVRSAQSGSGLGSKSVTLIERQVVGDVNKYRSSKGKNALLSNSELQKIARRHSEYMRRDAKSKGRPTHISHDGAKKRFAKMLGSGYVATSENVGMVMGVAEKYVSVSLVEGWIDSKPHHKAIKGDWRETGVGVAIGENNTVYATQLFAR